MSRIALCLGLAAATVTVGLVLRLVPLGLPFPVTKYGGSALWALMVYLLVAAGMPRMRRSNLALIALALAWAVEFSRLVHLPDLDAFRLTLAGALLLGRVFSVRHLLIYAFSIGLAALVDAAVGVRGRAG